MTHHSGRRGPYRPWRVQPNASRAARLRVGLTQAQFAEWVGVSRRTLVTWEKDDSMAKWFERKASEYEKRAAGQVKSARTW